MKKIIIFAILLILIFGGGWVGYKQYSKNHKPQQNTPKIFFKSSSLEISYPAIDESIVSPITITGRAQGPWFFEASFPVLITDSDNKLMGTGVAQAKGDWMTTDFVDFTADLYFSKPTTPTGFIVFKNDNPSGLPANDKSEKFEIKFK